MALLSEYFFQVGYLPGGPIEPVMGWWSMQRAEDCIVQLLARLQIAARDAVRSTTSVNQTRNT
jgi:hypothetical protein